MGDSIATSLTDNLIPLPPSPSLHPLSLPVSPCLPPSLSPPRPLDTGLGIGIIGDIGNSAQDGCWATRVTLKRNLAKKKK